MDEADELRARVEELERQLNEKEDELLEFQIDSKELEAELEREIERLAAENGTLKSRAARLQHDLGESQARAQSNLAVVNDALEKAQAELAAATAEIAALRSRTVELEYENDELARRRREAECAASDYEARYNRALETNAALELELEGKAALDADAQRLRDELRDLHTELEVRERIQDHHMRSGMMPPSPRSSASRASSRSRSPSRTVFAALPDPCLAPVSVEMAEAEAVPLPSSPDGSDDNNDVVMAEADDPSLPPPAHAFTPSTPAAALALPPPTPMASAPGILNTPSPVPRRAGSVSTPSLPLPPPSIADSGAALSTVSSDWPTHDARCNPATPGGAPGPPPPPISEMKSSDMSALVRQMMTRVKVRFHSVFRTRRRLRRTHVAA
ncbi:NADH:ubiquinone oxidoreductase [Blastocladiella emersonii ATCC 22665]|nr:NADH:ubiquinone oxidoreductase [Blastocladiella emersonii ATCC 22665]